jgi:hypothetical protein
VREQPERLDRPVLRPFFMYARARDSQASAAFPRITCKSAAPAATLVGALSGALDPRVPKLGPRVDVLGFAGGSSLRTPLAGRQRPSPYRDPHGRKRGRHGDGNSEHVPPLRLAETGTSDQKRGISQHSSGSRTHHQRECELDPSRRCRPIWIVPIALVRACRDVQNEGRNPRNEHSSSGQRRRATSPR